MDDLNRFTMIPTEVMVNGHLSNCAKLIYGLINSYCKMEKKMCTVNNKKFMEILKVTDRTIRRSLEELRDEGLIKIAYKGQGKREITTTWKIK